MITLIRHGVEPLEIHAAISDMEAEARKKLKGIVIIKGSKSTHNPAFNEEEEHAAHHISVETTWDKALEPEAQPTKRVGK